MDFRSGGNADPPVETQSGLGPEIGGSRVSHDMEGIFGAAKQFPNKETSPNFRPITAIVASDRDVLTRRSGIARKLALPGVAIMGALAISIVLARHGITNLPSRQNAGPPLLPTPHLAQLDRVPALVRSQADSTAPTREASKHATRTSATVGSRFRPRRVTHKHNSTRHLVMRQDLRAPTNAQGFRSLSIGTRSPGYSYAPHDHYAPYAGYDAYAYYYREGARIEWQRLEELRRQEARRRHHRKHDDDD
jgi:hypothetical protein